MRQLRSILAAAAIAVTACSGGSGAGGEAIDVVDEHAFDGTWVVCRNDLGGDFREIFAIDGASGTFDLVSYATADATCDGDPTSEVPLAVTAVYGEHVTARLGAASVQAAKVDVTPTEAPSQTFYTLMYRDAAATPDVLYLGDDSGALDGSTPALRPVDLQPLARALQAAPVPADLTGEWRFCPANGDGVIMTFDAANGTFEGTRYFGACEGTALVQLSATYTLAPPVYASLGTTTVTAFAVDLTATGPLPGSAYITFWVDTEASPRRLYQGNFALHGMDGQTPSRRPRVLAPGFGVKQ